MKTLSETRKQSKEQSSKYVDTDHDDDDVDDVAMVTPERKRSQASMTEILNVAMSVK
jgi:hypothetical protein